MKNKPADKSMKLLAGTCFLPLVLVITIWAMTPITSACFNQNSDGLVYQSMAECMQADQEEALTCPPASRKAPWCRRILTPFLAAQLPSVLPVNFTIVAFVANWISLALVYLIVRTSGFSFMTGLIAQLLYAGVFWSVKWSFCCPLYIDFLTQTFILAILYHTIVQKYYYIPVITAIGVLQKESILLLVPVVALHYLMHSSGKVFACRKSLYFVLLAGLPTGVLLSVHLLIQPDPPYNMVAAITAILRQQLAMPDIVQRIGLCLTSGLGILPFLLIMRPAEVCNFIRNNKFWGLYLVISLGLLVCGSDKSRLFLYALPAIVIMAAHVIEPLTERLNAGSIVWLAAGLGVHYYLGCHFTPTEPFDPVFNRMIPLHAPGPFGMILLKTGCVVAIFVALTIVLRPYKRASTDRKDTCTC